jgi:uncharacterized protein
VSRTTASKPEVALRLNVLDGRLAVCRMEPGAGLPEWATRADFFSITRAPDELSVVCPEGNVPESVGCEKGWRALKLAGPFEFSLTGVLASVLDPLARAGVSVFAVSTFDTDYVLVKEDRLRAAVAALREAGHEVRDGGTGVTVGPAENEEEFLWKMLYEAVHWGPEERGPKPPPGEILTDPVLRRYLAGWGRPGDFAVVARDESGRKVGAAWYRIFTADEPGYGFVDADTPDIVIAVAPDRRGAGVGGALLGALMDAARSDGFDAISLSVQKSNHAAARLYEKSGFARLRDDGDAWIMKADLSADGTTNGAPTDGAQRTEET